MLEWKGTIVTNTEARLSAPLLVLATLENARPTVTNMEARHSAPKHAPSMHGSAKYVAQSMVVQRSALQHAPTTLEVARYTVICMEAVPCALRLVLPTMGGGKTGAMLDAEGTYCVLAADPLL
jgi:hypothetical protein